MAAYTWALAANGNWDNGANWTGGPPGTFPTATDTALIDVAGSYTVLSDSATEAAAGVVLNNAAATLSIAHIFTIGTSLTVQSGTLALQFADIKGTGDIVNGGTMAAVTSLNFIETTGTVTNNGVLLVGASDKVVIANTFINAGSVLVDGGWFSVDGAYNGPAGGTVTMSNGAHFGMAATAGGANTFIFGAGTHNVLDVDIGQVVAPVIANMVVGDYLALANANPFSLTQPTFDGTTLSYTDGSNSWSFTMTGVAAGTTFQAIRDPQSVNGSNGIDLMIAPPPINRAVSDFNGSGTSDILFRDPATGGFGDFLMSNGQPTWASIGWADPRLGVAGTGDFNGDGTADILLRDPVGGNLGQFVMTNNQAAWAAVGWADPRLQVVGTGDFNGDGTADILFRDPASGNLSDFLMHAGQPSWAAIGWADPRLAVVGVGDFNGDGTSDILFRDLAGGALSEFSMHNNQPTWSAVGWADPRLQVAGVGDFNGDGTDDILFRDPSSGGVSDFLMHGGQPTYAFIGNADPRLQVVGIGDYQGNGTSDILFRDPVGGGLGQFAMQNNQATWAAVGSASPTWHVAA